MFTLGKTTRKADAQAKLTMISMVVREKPT